MNIKFTRLLPIFLLLSSCSEPTIAVQRTYYIDIANEKTFVNKAIYITNEKNSMSCTYFTKEAKPVVSKAGTIVDYFDDEMKSDFIFKEGYSLDSKLKDNEVILPSRLLLEAREVTFKDGTIPADLYYSSKMTNDDYNEIFTRILSEDLQYSFYIDVNDNEKITQDSVLINVVGIYNYMVSDLSSDRSLYRMPMEYNEYYIYATSIVSDTLFDKLEELNNKGMTRKYIGPYDNLIKE